MESVSEILTIAGISITVFLSTFFAGSFSRNRSNILLVLILLAFIPFFLAYNLNVVNNEERVFTILPFSCLSLLLIGPLLYEYAFHFFNVSQQKIFEQYRLYIPFFLVGSLLLISHFLFAKDLYTYILIAAVAFSYFHLLYFLMKLIRYQAKSSEKLKHFYANLSDKDIFWVNVLIIGLFFVLVLDSISGIIIRAMNFTAIPIVNTIFLLALTWYLGYCGLSQKRITKSIASLGKEVDTENAEKENLCQTTEYQMLQERLVAIVDKKEMYKAEEINLSILSQQLGVPIKKVSYLLNQCMGTSFYDFMNGYRLSAFKQKVEAEELKHKTILAIAFESGFASKASFNRIFKKEEGVSPSQYVKSMKKRSHSLQ